MVLGVPGRRFGILVVGGSLDPPSPCRPSLPPPSDPSRSLSASLSDPVRPALRHDFRCVMLLVQSSSCFHQCTLFQPHLAIVPRVTLALQIKVCTPPLTDGCLCYSHYLSPEREWTRGSQEAADGSGTSEVVWRTDHDSHSKSHGSLAEHHPPAMAGEGLRYVIEGIPRTARSQDPSASQSRSVWRFCNVRPLAAVSIEVSITHLSP